jgi:hypothetical protein
MVCHGGSMILHPVVHLHVMNSHKHLFLQKRPKRKLFRKDFDQIIWFNR